MRFCLLNKQNFNFPGLNLCFDWGTLYSFLFLTACEFWRLLVDIDNCYVDIDNCLWMLTVGLCILTTDLLILTVVMSILTIVLSILITTLSILTTVLPIPIFILSILTIILSILMIRCRLAYQLDEEVGERGYLNNIVLKCHTNAFRYVINGLKSDWCQELGSLLFS